MFKVLCTSKTDTDRNPDGNVGPKWLFCRPFKVETSKQAIKLAKAYARKKGIDLRGCKLEAFYWK